MDQSFPDRCAIAQSYGPGTKEVLVKAVLDTVCFRSLAEEPPRMAELLARELGHERRVATQQNAAITELAGGFQVASADRLTIPSKSKI